MRSQLRDGKLDDRTVEVEVKERSFPAFEVISNSGVEEMDINLKDILPGFLGQRTKKRKMKVAEAIEFLIQEEEQKLVDMEQVTRDRSRTCGKQRYRFFSTRLTKLRVASPDMDPT